MEQHGMTSIATVRHLLTESWNASQQLPWTCKYYYVIDRMIWYTHFHWVLRVIYYRSCGCIDDVSMDNVGDTLGCASFASFRSNHIFSSSVIYYWTDSRQHRIYLLRIFRTLIRNKSLLRVDNVDDNNYVSVMCLLVSFWLSVFRLLLSPPSQRTRSFVAFDHSISFKFFSMATEDINWNSFHCLCFIDLWVSFQSSGTIRSKLILNVNF